MHGRVVVSCEITAPQVTVPSLEALTVAEATALLVQAGLVVGEVVSEANSLFPVGVVIQHTPFAGERLATGNRVSLTVSSGPTEPQSVQACLSPTIFVVDGYVVGGPDDGKVYSGTLRGSRGDDIMAGTDDKDLILPGSGNDTVCGYGGDDEVRGSRGDDLLFGGAGNDRLFGQLDNDEVHGGDGNDLILGADGADQLYGDAGDDKLNGQDGEDFVYGGDGADILVGGPDNDQLYGEQGDDTLSGQAQHDFIVGGEGEDTVNGGGGTDTCFGEIFASCEKQSADLPPAEGQVLVPNLIALSLEAATDSLLQSGLTLGTVSTESSDTISAGDVIRQILKVIPQLEWF